MKHNWEYKKLGEVVSSINGLWTGKKEPFITIPVISLKNFTKDCKLKKEDYSIIDVEVRQFESRKLQYGDIIVEKSGGSDTQPVGRPILFDIKEGDYSFSNFTTTLRVNDANKASLNSLFLHNVLLAYYRQGKTFNLQSKTTGIHNLDLKSYLKLPIPVPPLPTQQSIVSELDSLSKIIADCKETLKDYDALEQSIFYDMFGDPVKNDKGWEVKKLGDCYKVTSSKRIYLEELTDNGIPFLKVADVNNLINGECKPTTFISDEKYNELKINGYVPKANDLIVTARGTIGNVYIVKKEDAFYFQDGMITWLKQSNYNTDAIFIKNMFLVPCFLNYLEQFSNNSTVAFLSISKLANVYIPVPPLALQQTFASKIEAIERMKAETKEALQEAETLFQARMDYWFN